MASESDDLRERIAREIDAGGPIPFVRFMQRALYEPEIGYYTGPREKIGKDGDFYTSLDIHPVFGRLVGRQVIEMAPCVPDGPYTIVEMGAGKGLLAYDVLRELRDSAPELLARLTYRVVEVSPSMVRRQQAVLGEFEDRVRWHERLEDVPECAGVFLSNELVDSFPHHQVVVTPEGLREVFVTHAGGRFTEVLRAPSTPRLEAYLAPFLKGLPEGYRTEVNLAALDWIAEVGGRLGRGHVLTVDYGYPADVYYAAGRATGTFLCHHEHKVSAEPYVRVGRQDMTAHVDFSALAKGGLKAGLHSVGMTDQAHFLVGLGVAERMQAVLERDGGDPDRSDEFRAMRHLMDPEGLGKVFKVLVQEKGVRSPPFSGLKFAAFSISDLLGPGSDNGSPGGGA